MSGASQHASSEDCGEEVLFLHRKRGPGRRDGEVDRVAMPSGVYVIDAERDRTPPFGHRAGSSPVQAAPPVQLATAPGQR